MTNLDGLFLGRERLAAALDVSPATIDRLEKAGTLPRRRRLGLGRVGWLRSEVEAALATLPSGPNTSRTEAARRAPRKARRGRR